MGVNAVVGHVHGSEIFDEGEATTLFPGTYEEYSTFFIFNMGVVKYRLDKDEELKNGYSP